METKIHFVIPSSSVLLFLWRHISKKTWDTRDFFLLLLSPTSIHVEQIKIDFYWCANMNIDVGDDNFKI